MSSSSFKIPSSAEVLSTDALTLFGVIELEVPSSSLKNSSQQQQATVFYRKILESKGKLSDPTIQAINRLNRKLSLFFHPDKNPAGRDAFEKLQKDADFVRDPESMMKYAREKDETVKKAVDKMEQMTAAEAARAKLAESINAQKELKRQQQQRAAKELERKLQLMKGGGDSSFSTSSTSHIQSSMMEKDVFERERKAQMSDWERLEEDMLNDWDVDTETLKRKEEDVTQLMDYLSKRSRDVGAGTRRMRE